MIVRILCSGKPRVAGSKPWRWAQRFFLTVGLLAVGYITIGQLFQYGYQTYQNWSFDRAIAGRQPAPAVPSDGARSVVGKITIPRLRISAIVKEGVDDRTLDIAVGHIPATALPGQPGNVGVAAHRDTLFRNLKDVRRDDEIIVDTLDGRYFYRVVSYEIVEPGNVFVLAKSAYDNTLTLVTCYPFYFVGHAPKRFIVHARQLARMNSRTKTE